MSEKQEHLLLFGFWDAAGDARKVAAVKVSHVNGDLRQVVVRQLDAIWLGHNTLHYTESEIGQPSRYQFQHDHPELFVGEDRPDAPEVLEQPIRDVEASDKLWGLQAIPFWPDRPEIYERMSDVEVAANREGIANFEPVSEDQLVSGHLETCLVASGNDAALKRRRQKVQERGLRCWRVFRRTRPWILGYMQIRTVPRSVIERLMDKDNAQP